MNASLSTLPFPTTTTSQGTEDVFWADSIIITMISCGFVGTFILFCIICHTIYHFSHDHIKVTGWTRYVNLFTFFESMLACLAYALLKVDVILPVGTIIPCSLGYVIPLLLVGYAKVFTFLLFTLRIHTTFQSSAMAYPPKYLLSFVILYLSAVIVASVFLLYFAIPIVEYRFTADGIGVCSIFEGSLQFRATLALSGLTDVGGSGVLVYLFVRKLRLVKS